MIQNGCKDIKLLSLFQNYKFIKNQKMFLEWVEKYLVDLADMFYLDFFSDLSQSQ